MRTQKQYSIRSCTGLAASLVVVATTLLAMASSATASTEDYALKGKPRADAFMKVYGKTLPPIGYVDFCAKFASECGNGSGIAKRIRLNDARWDEMVKVNDYVNAKIEPITDQDLYNVPENWTIPTTQGDCEDYVLLKRRYLVNLGWPIESLLITVVRDPDTGGHAVLTIATDMGDFILDNLNPDVLPWRSTKYIYYKRQSQARPNLWVSVKPGTPSANGTLTGTR